MGSKPAGWLASLSSLSVCAPNQVHRGSARLIILRTKLDVHIIKKYTLQYLKSLHKSFISCFVQIKDLSLINFIKSWSLSGNDDDADLFAIPIAFARNAPAFQADEAAEALRGCHALSAAGTGKADLESCSRYVSRLCSFTARFAAANCSQPNWILN